MRIGEFARRAGVSASKVRFYEARGLLPASSRAANGYRIYDEADLRVISFVDRARALGFPLADIALFMARPAEARRAKEGVVPALEAKLAEADRLMADLGERRNRIAAALAELKGDPHREAGDYGDPPSPNVSLSRAAMSGASSKSAPRE